MIAFIAAVALSSPTVSVQAPDGHWLRFNDDGRSVYARQAKLVAIDGKLCHERGYPLIPRLQAPSDVALEVFPDRMVQANGQDIGQLVLWKFEAETPSDRGDGLRIARTRPVRATVTTDSTPSEPEVSPSPAPAEISAPASQPSSVTDGEVRIRLADTAEITGPKTELGEVAEIEAPAELLEKLKNLELGLAPPITGAQTVSRSLVVSRLRQRFDDWEEFDLSGQSVRVRLQADEINESQFVDFAKSQLEGRVSDVETLSLKTPISELRVPVGELKLVASNVTVSGTLVSLTVTATVDGERAGSRSVRFENTAPAVLMRIGSVVRVILISSGAEVATSGSVRSSDPATGTVVVRTETGALLTGTPRDTSTVEVRL